MLVERMNAAVGKKAEKMDLLIIIACVVKGVDQDLVPVYLTRFALLVDLDKILVDDPAGSYVQVPNL